MQAAAEAAELLVRGFAQQQHAGQLPQGHPQQQPQGSPAGSSPQQDRDPELLQPLVPGGAAAAGGAAVGASVAVPQAALLGPPSAAPSLSTHSQSRSQSQVSAGGRRCKLSGSSGPAGFAMPRGKAAKAAQGDTTLHPVLRMGWQPLCSVVCNGLTGEFLGGHGMDLYIRCTAPGFVGLPLIDISLGGCVMTCSQFEKAAGRELSKKWKESIHVLGEGVGSMSTLISWMKRRAAQDFGAQVVGKSVWVCWCGDSDFYQGRIASYSRETGKHVVQYSDSHSEELHLPVELLSFDPVKPRLAQAYPPVSAAMGRAGSGGTAGTAVQHAARQAQQAQQGGAQQEAGQAAQPATIGRGGFSFLHGPQPESVDEEPRPMNPLWHQGSGISVTSSFLGDEPTAAAATGGAAALGAAALMAAAAAAAGTAFGGQASEHLGQAPASPAAMRQEAGQQGASPTAAGVPSGAYAGGLEDATGRPGALSRAGFAAGIATALQPVVAGRGGCAGAVGSAAAALTPAGKSGTSPEQQLQPRRQSKRQQAPPILEIHTSVDAGRFVETMRPFRPLTRRLSGTKHGQQPSPAASAGERCDRLAKEPSLAALLTPAPPGATADEAPTGPPALKRLRGSWAGDAGPSSQGAAPAMQLGGAHAAAPEEGARQEPGTTEAAVANITASAALAAGPALLLPRQGHAYVGTPIKMAVPAPLVVSQQLLSPDPRQVSPPVTFQQQRQSHIRRLSSLSATAVEQEGLQQPQVEHQKPQEQYPQQQEGAAGAPTAGGSDAADLFQAAARLLGAPQSQQTPSAPSGEYGMDRGHSCGDLPPYRGGEALGGPVFRTSSAPTGGWASLLAEAAAIAEELQHEKEQAGEEGAGAAAALEQSLSGAQAHQPAAAEQAAAAAGGASERVAAGHVQGQARTHLNADGSQPLQPQQQQQIQAGPGPRVSCLLTPLPLTPVVPLPARHHPEAPAWVPAQRPLATAPAEGVSGGPQAHARAADSGQPPFAAAAEAGVAVRSAAAGPGMLAPPPPAGFQEEDPAVMARWLHTLALQLEALPFHHAPTGSSPQTIAASVILPSAAVTRSAAPAATQTPRQDAAASTDAPGGVNQQVQPPHTSGAKPALVAPALGPSPSARFQARVALARRDGTLRGIYEAMVCRYEFCAHDPEALPSKIWDLMLGLLWEAGPGPAPQHAQQQGHW
ncbi:hypothetical protein N2152v2_007034 [Parachlorella kessleri]